ncbi:BRO-N domain-containing protein, partial [Acetobacter tropicalis]|uniref:BRO-N domain-containing protein n=1 Tax=Acetobacter tropicalis TaxID=104102 RepID=UPI0038D0A1EB
MLRSSLASSTRTLSQTNRSTQVRTIMQNGEPWWVLADVCKVLDLKNPTHSANRLDDDERATLNVGRQGEATIINESGL